MAETIIGHERPIPMQRVLLTGAAGGIGGYLRKLLPPIYPGLVLSDLKAPKYLGPSERFIAADLTKPAEIERACEGIEGIIHLGGQSTEAPWETILNANIIGCYNLFEAARKAGVKRVIFATSNHAVGFYPRTTTIGTDVIPRPDSRYGVSKLFGEGLGAMYAYKHGIGVTSIRIGNVGPEPLDARRLSIWIRPDDLVQLIRIGLERPGLVYEVMYGVSDNARSWYDNSHARALGYAPQGRSEDFAADVLAKEPATGKHPASEHYQGGTFCGDEYSADFDAMKTKG
jgi:uronate dehydrogenase